MIGSESMLARETTDTLSRYNNKLSALKAREAKGVDIPLETQLSLIQVQREMSCEPYVYGGFGLHGPLLDYTLYARYSFALREIVFFKTRQDGLMERVEYRNADLRYKYLLYEVVLKSIIFGCTVEQANDLIDEYLSWEDDPDE
ncbi:hypothetical protein ACLPJK_26175 [Pseudomonas aeruginosa]|uniref:hypothetical protein n=1 Tax=Pseudomonas aeruginosa TaxID=287 RepID=UPI003D2A11C5